MLLIFTTCNENDKKAQMITRDCDPIHEYGQFVAGVCVGVVIMAVMSFILSYNNNRRIMDDGY